MREKTVLLGMAATAALVAGPASGQLFSEDFDDGVAITRWSPPIFAVENPDVGPDSNVTYAFNYATFGIPSAPNSVGGTTVGLLLESNLNDDTDGDEGDGVAVVPTGFTLPAGDFVFTADAYMFLNGESGSTEYFGIGVHSDGSAAPLRFGLDSGSGVNWQIDSDGDSGTDLFRFEGAPVGAETSLGEWEDIPDGTIPGVGTGAADPLGPANQWVELEIASAGGVLTFSVNGAIIDTLDNTGGEFTGGTIMLSHSDPFNSVNPDAFGASNAVIFDNISVIPEPASLALVGLGSLAMLRRRSA